MPLFDSLLRYGPPPVAWGNNPERIMRENVQPYVAPERQQDFMTRGTWTEQGPHKISYAQDLDKIISSTLAALGPSWAGEK